jgi:hypothetical protein
MNGEVVLQDSPSSVIESMATVLWSGRASGCIIHRNLELLQQYGTERPLRRARRVVVGAFNHTNSTDVDDILTSPGFGTITAAADPRIVRLRLELTFQSV